tara:strand:+ start:4150 stop:4380 length:231 start_codon:yes stop_codon:yes gene_type:complete
MSKRKQRERADRGDNPRHKKPDKTWKRESVPTQALEDELQDMVLRINKQLRCSCGAIYADVLAACIVCGKANPLNT